MYAFDEIRQVDNEIAEAIQSEMDRQNSHIELIASENWVSRAVMQRGIRENAITAAASVWM